MNAPIDPLADFRPTGHGLDDERRARLRDRVLGAIPDDPLVTHSRVTPLPITHRPDDLDRHDAPDRHGELAEVLVLEPLGSADRRHPGRRGRNGDGSHGRRLLAAAAVAVTLGLLAVVVGTNRSSDRQVGTLDESSTVTLEQLARRAAQTTDRPLGAGEYQHLVVQRATRDDDGSFHIDVDESWYASDDTGSRRTARLTRAAGAPNGGDAIAGNAGPIVELDCTVACFGDFTYQNLREAPTSAYELLQTVRSLTPTAQSWDIAEHLSDILALTTTPPARRAEVLEALSILGFQYAGQLSDPLDRAGVGFTLEAGDRTETIVFDADTGAVLAYWGGPPTADRGWPAAQSWTAFADADVSGPPA